MTFGDLLDLYEEQGDGKKYVLGVKQKCLEFFGFKKLSQITRNDLFYFRNLVKDTPKERGGRPVTESTVNRIMAGLRRVLNFAVNQELMEQSPFPGNPKSGLFYPEKKGLRKFFTEEQMARIIKASPDWLEPMILTAYYTGMRAGELLRLRWEHVNLSAGLIHLPSS